mmetsp:Transcript_7923/g.28973  ORF Transcript_7923/g.28973 Transcript_7923/m.28973 type:complete len:421 (-) Transcript_7923:297-1559(-)
MRPRDPRRGHHARPGAADAGVAEHAADAKDAVHHRAEQNRQDVRLGRESRLPHPGNARASETARARGVRGPREEGHARVRERGLERGDILGQPGRAEVHQRRPDVRDHGRGHSRHDPHARGPDADEDERTPSVLRRGAVHSPRGEDARGFGDRDGRHPHQRHASGGRHDRRRRAARRDRDDDQSASHAAADARDAREGELRAPQGNLRGDGDQDRRERTRASDRGDLDARAEQRGRPRRAQGRGVVRHEERLLAGGQERRGRVRASVHARVVGSAVGVLKVRRGEDPRRRDRDRAGEQTRRHGRVGDARAEATGIRHDSRVRRESHGRGDADGERAQRQGVHRGHHIPPVRSVHRVHGGDQGEEESRRRGARVLPVRAQDHAQLHLQQARPDHRGRGHRERHRAHRDAAVHSLAGVHRHR